ncbi:hypothetical protein H072_8402 [Dactylellina haptotyla CBS 200.50]|uniref:ML-like domain-containing protein n=1 Tax=Dactylellina haptotyla (strain CBS 200.50) TaxID=1284197 RepID=S8BR88_DACHA|nr:hypothetical protein H072_8402 [Dactylellina haptotyla CBS 200.50]
MMLRLSRVSLLSALFLGSLQVQAADILSTSGFASCASQDSDIVVNRFNVEYNKANMTVKFNVGGESKIAQEVTADLVVTAYGREVYRNSFDPCEKGITLLCPIPAGNFSAAGNLPIPPEFASQIPSIAFTIPDLDGLARLELKSKNGTGNSTLACLQSSVRNGKTAEQPAVTWVTAGIAGAAAILGSVTLISSAAGLGGSSGGGSSGPSPNIADVVLWFQFVSTNGMLSVNYPPVYRAFTKNFAWSTGLIPWGDMQRSIDSFRGKTGGNTTRDSYEVLQNTTLLYTSDVSSKIAKRSLDLWQRLVKRIDLETSVNGTTLGSSTATNDEGESKLMKQVHGIEAYVETLSIPSANTFLTVLLIFLIVLAGTAVFILLFKLILELYALCGKLNKPLSSFRKRYWSFLLGTMVRIILLMYGIWVIYCLYQFKQGDSWAANLLAGITLAIFTGILAFFAWRIASIARKVKKMDKEQLLEDKSNLRKYGLFYDQYKATFWWMFIPFIVYLFAKGAIIALGSGNGLVQSSGQLACELILFAFLVIGRPFNSKSGNVINIFIAVVRVISVACVLIFTEQLRISQTTTTVAGVALIVVQSVLTGLLAILIAVNAIVICCKADYYTKKRHDRQKFAEEAKMREAFDPHNPRESIMGPPPFGYNNDGKGKYQPTPTRDDFPMDDMYPPPRGAYMAPPHDRDGSPVPLSRDGEGHERSFSGDRQDFANNSRQSLIGSAAPVGHDTRFPPTSYDEYRGNRQF